MKSNTTNTAPVSLAAAALTDDARVSPTHNHGHLPPDPDNMNDDRAGWADTSLKAFRKATGADEEEALGDLLADLLHWCDRNNFDFEAALDRARMHYKAETTGEKAP